MFTATASLRKIDGDLFNKGLGGGDEKERFFFFKLHPYNTAEQIFKVSRKKMERDFIHSKDLSGSPNFTHQFLLTDPASTKGKAIKCFN
jgi:hypothetical protein